MFGFENKGSGIYLMNIVIGNINVLYYEKVEKIVDALRFTNIYTRISPESHMVSSVGYAR